MTTTGRYLLAVPLALCLLLTTYNGIVEGYNATHYADTAWMKAATVFQLAYGVLGAIGLYAMVRRPPWSRMVLLGWSLALVAEGFLAPVAYAGKGLSFGVAVALAVAAVAGVACWSWARGWLRPGVAGRAAA